MSVTNRLEDHWDKIKPLLKQEWPRLNDADLDAIDRHYDLLVQVIRERHGGRANIIQEAGIRDRLNQLLATLDEN